MPWKRCGNNVYSTTCDVILRTITFSLQKALWLLLKIGSILGKLCLRLLMFLGYTLQFSLFWRLPLDTQHHRLAASVIGSTSFFCNIHLLIVLGLALYKIFYCNSYKMRLGWHLRPSWIYLCFWFCPYLEMLREQKYTHQDMCWLEDDLCFCLKPTSWSDIQTF